MVAQNEENVGIRPRLGRLAPAVVHRALHPRLAE
jgi:hypothetical protein